MIISGLPFTLRQLEVFSRLAETGSFRLCAEKLGISQSSVSNQIKILEFQLGVTLFDRKPGRSPLLTSEGRAFESDLHALYRAASALASHKTIAGKEQETSIVFRLLVGQGMFEFYIRPKLDRFYADNPLIGLQFEIRPPTSDVPKLLEGGAFDFAMINQHVNMPPPPNTRPLAIVSGGVYGHRSFAEGQVLPLSPEAISLLPFFLPPASSRTEREALGTLARFGIRPRKVVGHSPYYDVTAAMLERGLAVATFSEPLLRPKARGQVIELMPLVNWRMLLFRQPAGDDRRRDAVEQFLVASTLGDPNFPVVERFPEAGGNHTSPHLQAH